LKKNQPPTSNSKRGESRKLERLREDLRKLHESLREEMLQKWQRVLPFDEILFDRWEKSRFVNAGINSSIYHNSYIYGDVRIGRDTWVGPYTLLDGSGGKLTIGNFCSVSTGVQVYTHNTVRWSLSGGKSPKQTGPVEIGNACYLGPYSLVTAGVEIGNQSLVGAFTLVNKNVPAGSIVFGIPGRIVGKVKTKGSTVDLVYSN